MSGSRDDFRYRNFVEKIQDFDMRELYQSLESVRLELFNVVWKYSRRGPSRSQGYGRIGG